MNILEHVKAVEEHEDYKVLRRITRKHSFSDDPILEPMKVLVVDTETTGTTEADQIIENAAVLIEVCPTTGRIGKVIQVHEGLEEPSVPIDPAAQKIHGISLDMVKGKTIDKEEYRQMYDQADLVLAHNSQFDREYIEKMFAPFGLDLLKLWGCTYKEINWSERGFNKSGLEYLVMSSGYFYGAHRAADDVFALIQCLATPSEDKGYPLLELLKRVREPSYMIKTTDTFDFKDKLKARGYFYDPTDKSWCRLMFSNGDIQAEVKSELKTLRDEVMIDGYGRRKGRVYFGKRDIVRKFTKAPFEYSEMKLETLKI